MLLSSVEFSHPFQWTQHPAPELKVLWTQLFHWILYRHLYLYTEILNTPSQNSSSLYPLCKMEIATYGTMKNQASPASCFKNHEINSLSISQISVPFLEYHHQLDDVWWNLPPWARLGTEPKLMSLKPPKIVPELTVPTQMCLSIHSSPALRDTGFAVKPRCCYLPATPRSQDAPFPHGQMARTNFGGSWCETPVDFSGSWTMAKVYFLCSTLFPATELLRRSLSPWYLKYCWYHKRPAWTPSKINVFLLH